jgi:hypothetical protein
MKIGWVLSWILLIIVLSAVIAQRGCDQADARFPQHLQSQSLQQLFVANLPFMDAQTQAIHTQADEVRMIHSAFLKEIKREISDLGYTRDYHMVIDAKGHKIPATTKNVNDLVGIVADQNLPANKRMKEIIDKFMNRYDVDIIVTGQYVDNPHSPSIMIRPIVIFKLAQTILTRNFQFVRYDLLCRNQGNNKIVLCKDAQRVIIQGVKTLLSQWTVIMAKKQQTVSDRYPPTGSGKKPVIQKPTVTTRIPASQSAAGVIYSDFMDSFTQSSITSITEMGKMIDEAVLKGTKEAKKKAEHHPDYAGQIASILFDPGLSKDERVIDIIDNVMIPNGVEIIVTGLYIRNIQNNAITLRPMVIVRASQTILSQNLEFTMNELVCEDPAKKEKILCKEAYEKIVRTVKELLEQV